MVAPAKPAVERRLPGRAPTSRGREGLAVLAARGGATETQRTGVTRGGAGDSRDARSRRGKARTRRPARGPRCQGRGGGGDQHPRRPRPGSPAQRPPRRRPPDHRRAEAEPVDRRGPLYRVQVSAHGGAHGSCPGRDLPGCPPARRGGAGARALRGQAGGDREWIGRQGAGPARGADAAGARAAAPPVARRRRPRIGGDGYGPRHRPAARGTGHPGAGPPMIASIRGRLRRKFEDRVVGEAAGVGYEVFVPPVVQTALVDAKAGEGDAADEVALAIHYHATQNQPRPVLIGFTSELDKEFFEKLITVKDVGPLVAARSLAAPVSDIAAAIARQDEVYLRRLPGIGPQKAKNIVAQLQAKVAKFALVQAGAEP